MDYWSEWPYAYTLHSSVSSIYCWYCFKCPDNLKVCSKCRLCRFCDTNCQKAGWPEHKEECNRLEKYRDNRAEMPDKHVRLVARIIFKLRKGDTGWLTIDGEERSFFHLMSHSDEILQAVEPIRSPKSTEEQLMVAESINALIRNKSLGRMTSQSTIEEQLKNTFQTADISKIMRGLDYLNFEQNLRAYCGEKSLSHLTEANLLDIYGKVAINSFGIDTSRNETIGTGVYIRFSLLDHSCNPDLSFIFDGPKAILRNQNISEKLENKTYKQLRISYLEPGLPRQVRQERLKGRYYFTCNCQFCLDQLREQRMQALICESPGCSGAALITIPSQGTTTVSVCEICHTVKNQDSTEQGLKLMENKNKLTEEFQLLYQKKEYEKAYQTLHELIPLVRAHLHPINRTRSEILLSLSNVSKLLLKYKECYSLREESLMSDQIFIPSLNPYWAPVYLEQAECLMLCGEGKLAQETLRKAVKIAEKSHGKDHQLTVTIRNLIKKRKK